MLRYAPPSLLVALGLLMLGAGPASAHEQVGVAGGFVSGFTHPIFGADHLIAMVAVGLWGAQLGRPLVWILPITFPLVMAFGGLLGLLDVGLPFVEVAIALSAIVLGIMVAFQIRPPVWVAAAIVAVFAIFHGHAHGQELPEAANPLAYSVGFVLATGLLHLTGILIGLVLAWPMGTRVVRACGVVITLLGGWFLASHMGVVGA